MSRRVGFSQRGQADISIGRKMRTFLLAHHNLRSLPCLDYVPPLKYSGTLGEWCNGSTADSGSACLGSNPSSPVPSRASLGFFASRAHTHGPTHRKLQMKTCCLLGCLVLLASFAENSLAADQQYALTRTMQI